MIGPLCHSFGVNSMKTVNRCLGANTEWRWLRMDATPNFNCRDKERVRGIQLANQMSLVGTVDSKIQTSQDWMSVWSGIPVLLFSTSCTVQPEENMILWLCPPVYWMSSYVSVNDQANSIKTKSTAKVCTVLPTNDLWLQRYCAA